MKTPTMTTMTKTLTLGTAAILLAATALGCSGGTTIIIQQVAADAGTPEPVQDAGTSPTVDAGVQVDATTTTDAAADAGVDAADAADAAVTWTWDAASLLCNRWVVALRWQDDPQGLGRVIDTVSGLHWHQKRSAPFNFNDAKAYCVAHNSRLPTNEEGNDAAAQFCAAAWSEAPQAWIEYNPNPFVKSLMTGAYVVRTDMNPTATAGTVCVYK